MVIFETKKMKKESINPKPMYMLLNALLLGVAFFIVVTWVPFVTADPLMKYWQPYSIIYVPVSYFCGIAFRKYHSYKRRSLRNVLYSILKSDLLALTVSFVVILCFPESNMSVYALLSFVCALFLLENITVFIYYSFRYAVNVERFKEREEVRIKAKELRENRFLDNRILEKIERLIRLKSGEAALRSLKKKTKLAYSNTLVIDTSSIFNIQNLTENRFSTIINLMWTNNIRGINDFLVAVHDKLPYEGVYVGCVQSKSQYKKKFFKKYPFGINYLLYSIDFFFKRIVPKWGFTREIYFWMTNGRKRILAKAEVFGRLYAAGFEVKDEFKAAGLLYFIAEKKKEPIRHEIFNYSPIIKLSRVGKNGKIFKVFKLRTMHPYSEFLQPYIYEKNRLQEGGKFNHDIRITTFGRMLRKFWLDELPMLFNLLKGDMKLVCVRPLSKHYFNLYSSELQEKRTKVKPGLLPPFYADMPKTLDEIQHSEMTYLQLCEEKGVLRTDVSYFIRILRNILFKKARSK